MDLRRIFVKIWALHYTWWAGVSQARERKGGCYPGTCCKAKQAMTASARVKMLCIACCHDSAIILLIIASATAATSTMITMIAIMLFFLLRLVLLWNLRCGT